MIRWWVDLWNRREMADALALVRVTLGLVIFVDLLMTASHGLIVPLYAPIEVGGLGDVLARRPVPELYRWFPPTVATAQVAFWTATVAAGCFTLGFFTRTSTVVLLLLLAQLALPVAPSDRGIDMLLRNALMVLFFSRCGAAWSLDARMRSGRWSGARDPVPSWPRYLLICQLVLLYSTAGMQKVASSWLPTDWSALYTAMRDPHFARGEWGWLDSLYPLTQAATASTWLWEWAAPLVLLAYWFRDTEDRPGRLRAFFLRHNVLAWYLAVGAFFHLGTHITMRLGIFPFAVLSLYPAFVHPDALAAWVRRWGAVGAD